MDVMNQDLKVMDATAIAFCRDNNIPIVVFDMSQPGALQSILEATRSARSSTGPARPAERDDTPRVRSLGTLVR